MRTIIDLDKSTIRKLKFLAVIENSTVTSLMEIAIQMYVNQKEVEILNNLSDE
jgi:predicted transcriptional regulator